MPSAHITTTGGCLGRMAAGAGFNHNISNNHKIAMQKIWLREMGPEWISEGGDQFPKRLFIKIRKIGLNLIFDSRITLSDCQRNLMANMADSVANTITARDQSSLHIRTRLR